MGEILNKSFVHSDQHYIQMDIKQIDGPKLITVLQITQFWQRVWKYCSQPPEEQSRIFKMRRFSPARFRQCATPHQRARLTTIRFLLCLLHGSHQKVWPEAAGRGWRLWGRGWREGDPVRLSGSWFASLPYLRRDQTDEESQLEPWQRQTSF